MQGGRQAATDTYREGRDCLHAEGWQQQRLMHSAPVLCLTSTATKCAPLTHSSSFSWKSLGSKAAKVRGNLAHLPGGMTWAGGGWGGG